MLAEATEEPAEVPVAELAHEPAVNVAPVGAAAGEEEARPAVATTVPKPDSGQDEQTAVPAKKEVAGADVGELCVSAV